MYTAAKDADKWCFGGGGMEGGGWGGNQSPHFWLELEQHEVHPTLWESSVMEVQFATQCRSLQILFSEQNEVVSEGGKEKGERGEEDTFEIREYSEEERGMETTNLREPRTKCLWLESSWIRK